MMLEGCLPSLVLLLMGPVALSGVFTSLGLPPVWLTLGVWIRETLKLGICFVKRELMMATAEP